MSTFLLAQSTDKLYLSGKVEYLPSEIISNDSKDINGELCAGLVITSDLSGFTYDSYNGIVKVVKKPGRDFLFLSPTERITFIFKTGYEPFKIVLSDLGVTLESGQVWELRITGDKKDEKMFNIQRGSFTLITEPTGADLTLMSDSTFRAQTPFKFVDYPEDKYTLIISMPDYQKKEIEIDILAGQELTKTVSLVPTFGYVVFQSEVSDAELYINNTYESYLLNQAIKVPVGQTHIEVRKRHYNDFFKTFNVEPNDNTERALVINLDMVRRTGFIELETDPENAMVYLDDKFLGVSPLEAKVFTGQHELKIEMVDYLPIIKEITIYKDQVLEEDIDLIKKKIKTD